MTLRSYLIRELGIPAVCASIGIGFGTILTHVSVSATGWALIIGTFLVLAALTGTDEPGTGAPPNPRPPRNRPDQQRAQGDETCGEGELELDLDTDAISFNNR